ncbi:tetratricopeptide repeat protein [Corallococcus sp. 4LFB]|uniref:tetratricopeptide repeat protein n=1 Tax=Corallococcus sp. 4LFB TaxID=3383249 RepID=UPI003974A192
MGRNIPSARSLADAAMGRAWTIEQTRPDDRKALFEAYLAAARLGKMEAMTNVGLHFLLGDGVRRDPKRSRMWIERAATLGDDLAAFNLGLAYDNGNGVRKNKGLAEAWYRRAIALGAAAEGSLAHLLLGAPRPTARRRRSGSTGSSHGEGNRFRHTTSVWRMSLEWASART